MISTTRPDNDSNEERLAAEIGRRIAARPELASEVEVRLVDGRYVVVLDDALRTRLSVALTESAPSKLRSA